MNKLEKDYRDELELKYGMYNRLFLQSFEFLDNKNTPQLSRSSDWDEFFNDWNQWSKKQKQEYLYYISRIEPAKDFKIVILFVVCFLLILFFFAFQAWFF